MLRNWLFNATKYLFGQNDRTGEGFAKAVLQQSNGSRNRLPKEVQIRPRKIDDLFAKFKMIQFLMQKSNFLKPDIVYPPQPIRPRPY